MPEAELDRCGSGSGGGDDSGSDGMVAVLVNKLSMRFFRFQRGELVVLRSPEEPERRLVRRLVAVEEDHVAVAGPTPGSKAQVERIPKARGGDLAAAVRSAVMPRLQLMFAIQQSCALLLGMHACHVHGGCTVLRCCFAPLHTHLLSSAHAGSLLVRGGCRGACGGRRFPPGLGPRAAGAHRGQVGAQTVQLWATPYSGGGSLVEYLPQIAGCSSSPAKVSAPLAGCCRMTHVLWPPSRWGALPPQPSLTRVVGKGGTLEFLQPPSREQDWWS